MTDKEPERYYDWMLWKQRQDDALRKQQQEEEYFDKKWEEHKKMLEMQKAKIYESPDGGKTVYERDLGDPHGERKLVERDIKEVYLDLNAYRSLGNVTEKGDSSRIEYKYNENQLIAELKAYVDETYGMHYSKENFQATEFIIDGGHGTGFCIGNVLKYAQRYGKKGTRADARKDLMKVLHYALMQLHVHDLEDKK